MHYRLSPSSAYRWLNCPGSARSDLDNPDSEASIQGTITHAFAAQLLTGADVEHALRQKYQSYPDGLKAQVLAHANSFASLVAAQPQTSRHIELLIEHAFIENHGGTIDALLYDETTKTLHVMDLKTGSYAVEARENAQLMCYLNLGRQLYPDAEIFIGTIYQPKVNDEPDTVFFTRDQLDRLLIQVLDAATDDELHAGEHCTWCPLLTTCQEAERAVLRAAQTDFEVIGKRADKVEALESIIVGGQISVARINKAKKELVAMVQEGKTLHQTKIVYGLTAQMWKDEEKARKKLREYFGDELPLASPNQIQKKLKESGFELSWDDLTSRRVNGYKVVSRHAKGEPVDFAEGFMEIDQETDEDLT